MAIPIPGQPNVIAVAAPGPPGPPGGSVYVHTQSAPAATWIIEHNLNRQLHVTVIAVSGEIVYADVVQGTPNQTTITFAEPYSGSAVLS